MSQFKLTLGPDWPENKEIIALLEKHGIQYVERENPFIKYMTVPYMTSLKTPQGDTLYGLKQMERYLGASRN